MKTGGSGGSGDGGAIGEQALSHVVLLVETLVLADSPPHLRCPLHGFVLVERKTLPSEGCTIARTSDALAAEYVTSGGGAGADVRCSMA